jgi:hypothetical protein
MKALVLSSVFALAAALTPPMLSASDEQPVRLSLGSRTAEAAVRRAVQGARNRLAHAQCRRLFSEFRDAAGRKLQDNLDAQGQTAAGYLGLIVFADGGGLPQCRDRAVYALTPRGGRVTYICGPQFVQGESHSAFVTETVIIHEELHSLGLGEDPPSATEITTRVLESCKS